MEYNFGLMVHMIFVFALFFLYVKMMFNLNNTLNYIQLVNKINKIAPVIFMSIFNVFFIGLIVFIINDLSWSFKYIYMNLTLLIIFILEMKRYKKQKSIRTYDYAKQVDFISFAKKVYILDILLMSSSFLFI